MLQQDLILTVLVKATPVLTSGLEESMCVAGVTSGPEPEWIRLNPVPFRDLEDKSRFKKYEQIELRGVRPRGDRRAESWKPVEGSISVVGKLGTENAWSPRKQAVRTLGEPTMCELYRENASGPRDDVRSLGVVRPVDRPTLLITARPPDKIRKWEEKAEAIDAQASLFGSRTSPKPPLEAIPWVFKYRYTCADAGCRGHEQSIIDWEIVALYRKVRGRTNWQELMRGKFVDQMWASDRDTVLFVGNQAQHPQSFLVLGVFWPKKGGIQNQLL